MRINFHGAARFVTGSNHLIETKNGEKFLLDMGMFQGSKQEEKLNFEELPFAASEIDFVILSHAHIDHSGRLPKLAKAGFNGKIYTTPATKDLTEIMLSDSAHIQESDAEWENRKRERKGEALIEPLYEQADVDKAMGLFETYRYGEIFQVSENIKVRFRDAGHILGSAIIEIWVTEDDKTAKLVFTGDLGVKGHSLINDPEYIDSADYIIMESTYGNTLHSNYGDSLENLMSTIERVTSEGGTVIIPSFAVGRTQEIIYELNKHYELTHGGQSNPIKFFVDSPLAVRATKVFTENTNILHAEAQELIRSGDNIFAFPNLFYTKTVEESKALNTDSSPKVIISASGMATGGRVVHHLKHHLWDEKNAVIFVGYQAQGTAGRLISDGIDKIKLAGDWIANSAQIYNMPGFSAHADQAYIMEWLGQYKRKPNRIFLVHGEEDEMYPLRDLIQTELDIKVETPGLHSYVDLNFNDLDEIDMHEVSEANELQERALLDKQIDKIKLMIAEIEDREIDSSDMDREKRQAILRKLNELEDNLMDFNMLSGR